MRGVFALYGEVELELVGYVAQDGFEQFSALAEEP